MANCSRNPRVVFYLFLASLVFPISSHAISDARFFGTYCGNHTETYEVPKCIYVPFPICWKETESATFSITVRAEHWETGRGNGFVTGEGAAEGQGITIPVLFSGVVTGVGELEGTAIVPGRAPTAGSTTLSEDGNTLTLRAMDRILKLGKDQCGNAPPTAVITDPDEDGLTFDWGELEDLHGEGSDPEDELSELRYAWSSDRDPGWRHDGRLAQIQNLSTGRHRITFTVTDSGGLQAKAVREIFIENDQPNLPVIVEPVAHAEFGVGQCVHFRGHASDPEEGKLGDDSLVWTTDRAEGRLGTGGDFRCPSDESPGCRLGEGAHTISLTATDRGEASRSVSIPLTIEPRPESDLAPSVWIDSPADWHSMADYECVELAAQSCDPNDTSLSFTWSVNMLEVVGGVRTEVPFTDLDPSFVTSGKTTRFCPLEGRHLDTPYEISVEATDSDSGLSRSSQPIKIYVIPGGLI